MSATYTLHHDAYGRAVAIVTNGDAEYERVFLDMERAASSAQTLCDQLNH